MNFSTTQAADEVVTVCDPDIRPLFPVRYALNKQTLFAFADQCPDLTPPVSIDQLRNHELQRIRQGYIYIYAHNGHPDHTNSDGKGTWLVFRYIAGAGADDNSGHFRTDTDTHTHGQYQFCKYEWEDGADSDWHIRDSRRYPYAFVKQQVKIIDIAYSEERWPGHFFLMAELDGNIRSQLMTRVELEPEKTAHSAPLAELDQYVAEFMPDIAINPDANAVCYTAFQPDFAGRVLDCADARKHGRIIALPDHLGELLDINSAHLVKSHSLKNFSAEYQYPLVIGRAVKNLQEAIQEGRKGFFGFFKRIGDHPIGADYETFYHQIEADQQAIEEEIATLVLGHQEMVSRSGNHTLLAEAQIALQGLDSVTGPTDASRVDYVFFLMSRMFNTLGTSAHGSVALTQLLEDKVEDKSKKWFSIFVKSLTVMATASTELLQTYRTHFNILLSVTAKELAMVWVKSKGGILHKAPIEKILGVTQRNLKVLPGQLEEVLRINLAKLGFAGANPASLDMERFLIDIDTGPRPQTLVDIPFYKVTATGNLNVQGQQLVTVYQNVKLGIQGGGMLLGLYSAFHAVSHWHSVRGDQKVLGEYDPVARIVVALLDTFAAGKALHSAVNTAQFTQGISQQVFAKLFQANTTYFQAISASTQNLARTGGVAANLSRFVTIGNIAGVAGILLSGVYAFEAAKTNDRAALIGNSLVALGGAVILMFGASGIGTVVGLVLIISGTLITLGQDSDVDAWVKRSFWGSSEQYWEGKKRPMPISLRIDRAKVLSDPDDPEHKKRKEDFDKELEGYNNLTWRLRIENAVQGDGWLKIYFPGIESATDVERLSLSINYATRTRGDVGFVHYTVLLDAISIQKHFAGYGMVQVQILEAINPKRLVSVRAGFPKSSGGEFKDEKLLKGKEL